MADLIVDLFKNDREIRFLSSLLVSIIMSFALPDLSVYSVAIYSAALGYRS